jgi:anti-sigma B factor antagonist
MTRPDPPIPNGLWRLQIARESRDDVRILFVSGRIGASGAPVLGRALMEELGAGQHRLLVDLGGVDYMSSAGLRVLQEAVSLARAHAARLALCSLSEPVRLAIDLAGATEQFTIEATCDGGVAVLHRDQSAP